MLTLLTPPWLFHMLSLRITSVFQIFPKLLGMWISKDCVPSSWRPRITTYRIRLFHLRLYHIAYFQTTFFVKILLTLFLTTCYLLMFLGEHLMYNATIDALSSIMTLFFFCELLWNNGHCPLCKVKRRRFFNLHTPHL